ncbi:MAG: hypothetical protein ACJAS1_003807 [Oleiphilaceae bacterium]|jgi:hypothetical protein
MSRINMEKKMNKLASVYFIAAMLTMGCTVNAKNTSADNSIGASQSYHWYDGNKKITVHLDEALIADFNPDSDQAAKAAKNTNLSSYKKIAGAQLWKVDPGSMASAKATVKSQSKTGAYSEVLRDSKAKGQMRALPGGVIVQFANDWDEARVSAWINEQGLSIDSKAEFGSNFYILTTPSGLESLEIANRLYETGEVLLASPNWWKAVYPK